MPLRFSVHTAAKGALSPAALTRLRRQAGRMLVAAALATPRLGPARAVECGLILTDDSDEELTLGVKKLGSSNTRAGRTTGPDLVSISTDANDRRMSPRRTDISKQRRKKGSRDASGG